MTALAGTINLFFRVLSFVVLARVIISWIRVSPYHPTWGPIIRAIYQITEPIMEPVRRVMPNMGGLDFSPIIVLLGLDLIRVLILNVLL